MLALAALYEVTEKATAAPFHAPLQLRALLWLLYQRSDRNREPYASYWNEMMDEEGGVQAGYCRATYARMHWCGIVRSVGGKPEPMDFKAAILDLVRAHREKSARP